MAKSIALFAFAALAAPALAADSPAPSSPFYGRWTVDDSKAAYTVRGRLYKTLDIAPCGHDFCGVSVSDKGQCGPGLFRFLAKHADGSSELQGHALWGGARKNIVIDFNPADKPEAATLTIYIGDGYDFGERSDNMPKYNASYARKGRALCMAR